MRYLLIEKYKEEHKCINKYGEKKYKSVYWMCTENLKMQKSGKKCFTEGKIYVQTKIDYYPGYVQIHFVDDLKNDHCIGFNGTNKNWGDYFFKYKML